MYALGFSRFLPLMLAVLCGIPLASLDAYAQRSLVPPTSKERVPWVSKSQSDRPKIIYGSDNRIDVYQESDPEIRALAASLCGLVFFDDISENPDGSFELETFSYSVNGLTPCGDERFGDQPTAPFCTGFRVGPDLIATAGHCFSLSDFGDVAFVFGFQMTDADTPVTTFSPDRIYRAVEIVDWQLENSGADYAIVRVDRPITAPGARILEVRHAGAIPEGTRIGAIGHPVGLPLKIVFGDETVVRDSSDPNFFVSNLDSFGGNSGSPVFNAETHVVEGILVRGDVDFEFDEFSRCFRSNMVDVDGARGEDSTKTTVFANVIRANLVQLSLDRLAYTCGASVSITLFDFDLGGTNEQRVSAFSTSGDFETFTLTATDVFGTFQGTVALSDDAQSDENGTLEVVDGDGIVFVYSDEDDGAGFEQIRTVSAIIDCTAPVVNGVALDGVTSRRVMVRVETDEPVYATVRVGETCGDPTAESTGDLNQDSLVVVSGLDPETSYSFKVVVEDLAGNLAGDDNAGQCYSFATAEFVDFLTKDYPDGTSDLEGTSVTFRPNGAPTGYTVCREEAVLEYHVAPQCGKQILLADDNSYECAISDGKSVPFFGQNYTSFFVNSNGNITFGAPSFIYDANLSTHFATPRISGLFEDLFPPAGGSVIVSQLGDRVAITYDEVQTFSEGQSVSFQIELFFSGEIRITWLKVDDFFGVAGLSNGDGVDPDFEATEFSDIGVCEDALQGGVCPNDRITVVRTIVCQGNPSGASGQFPTGDLVVIASFLVFTARRSRRQTIR